MKIRTFPVTMAAALCFFTTAQTVLAAPFFNRATPNTVRAAKVQNVSFRVRNDTPQALTFKAGDQSFTLKVGETLSIKLPLGMPLTAESATPHFAIGSVMATVNKDLQGNTLIFG